MVLLILICFAGCGRSPVEIPREDTEGENQSPEPSPEQVSIAEEVVIDEQGIRIQITALEEARMGPELKVQIENSSEVSVTVQVRKTSVNGFMIEPIFSCDVAPGKKAVDGISFYESDMERHNIEVITNIELVFHVFNATTWETVFRSQPVQIITTAADKHSQTYDSAGDVLIESAGIKIVFQGLSEDYLGPVAKLYIENNTDEFVSVQAKDTSVNGFMISPVFSCEITPGKKVIDGLSFYEDDIAEHGIDAIQEIELRFIIFNPDSWKTILETEYITITP